MKLKISMPEPAMDLKPRITVVGVGGAGGNAVNNMIRSNLTGVEFLVANTDAQALEMSSAEACIQLGLSLTHGLGAGARPDIGRASAEEALEDIMDRLSASHMVFITAGMGGGTGTGAAPVIARAAREAGVLTVGVVTKPFHFEGANRMRIAEAGIEELSKHVDTLIIIPNQNLFRIANERTTFAEAFQMADDVLYSGVRGVTDLMVMPGLINLDFADIRTVMAEMGKAMMGTGEAEGEDRAKLAAESAISNPLLDEVSMHGARGVLINITGGQDMTLLEVDAAANRIREEVDSDANIIFGATMDGALDGRMRVSIVATGIDTIPGQKPLPIEPFTATDSRRPELIVTPAAMEPRTAAALLDATPVEAAIGEAARHDAAQPSMLDAVANQDADISEEIEPEAEAEDEVEIAAAAPKPVVADWTFPSMVGSKDVSTEEAFIPPAPSIPPNRTADSNATPSRPTVVPDAGQTATGRSRRAFTSLLDRMTGGRAQEEAPAAEAAPAKPAAAAEKSEETTAEADKPASKADDYLDIPTFLRRQAN